MSRLPKRWRNLPHCPFFGWKICHPTRASAVDHANHLNRMNSARTGRATKVSVRMCGLCFAYHVGHRRKPRQH